MSKRIFLASLCLVLVSCAALPQEREMAGGTQDGQETLLSRQVITAQEQTARLEVRLAEFEKKIGVLGQLVRKLSQQQSRLEAQMESRRSESTSRSYSPPAREKTTRSAFPPRKKKKQKTAQRRPVATSKPPRRKSVRRAPAPPTPGQGTSSMQESYNLAYRSIRARKSEEAILHFRGFLRRFPKSRLAANAQYWLGESYYDLKEFPASLEEFQKVLTRYPKSRKVPDALYKRGLTYLRIKDSRRAALEFEKLIERFPRHQLTQKARNRLRAMRVTGVESSR